MTELTRRRLLQALGLSVVGQHTVDGAVADGAPPAEPLVYVGGDGWLYAIEATTGETHHETAVSGFVWTSPTVVGGTVYVGTRDGRLYALPDGRAEDEWTFETNDELMASPTVVDGTVYAATRSGDQPKATGTLYAIDAATGTGEWTYTEAFGGFVSSPAVTDGIVFIGGEDTAVHAVDATSGEQDWLFPGPDGDVRSSPTVARVSVDGVMTRVVYVGSRDGRLYALDASDGKLLWDADDPDDTVFSSPTVAIPTVERGEDDGRPLVYVGSSDTNMYAFDARTGDLEWQFNSPTKRTPASIAAYTPPGDSQQPLVCVVSSDFTGETAFGDGDATDGVVYALDARTGDTEWTFTDADGAIEATPTVADVDGGIVFVATYGGTLYALDAVTGQERWSAPIAGSRLHSSPAYVPTPGESASGSRARHWTLGHHDEFDLPPNRFTLSEVPTDDTGPSSEPADDSFPTRHALTAAGGIATVALGAYVMLRTVGRTKTDESQKTPTVGADDPPGSGTDPSETGKTPAIAETTTRDNRSEMDPPTTVPAPDIESVTRERIERGDCIGACDRVRVFDVADASGNQFVLKEHAPEGTLHTETAERLMHGCETWAKLDEHDHIGTVLGYGPSPTPWVATERLDAGTLADHAGDLRFERALWTAIAVTRAVRFAHRRGVTHTLLQPGTIRFAAVKGAWEVPKVLDWGGGIGPRELDDRYRAPEQQYEEEAAGDAVDIYQLGVRCYELFTGRYPYEEGTLRAHSTVVSPSDIAAVPGELDDILSTAMATDPDNRYETVVHFRNALQQLQGE